MPTRFVQDDQRIDYTPGSAVASGDVVVQGDLIGVAERDIPANTLGSLSVCGVFDFPKATGADTAIAAGTPVYWSASTLVATATATDNKPLGKTVKAASNTDATVRVRLCQ